MLDEKDNQIASKRLAAREQNEGPRLGDFVVTPGGELERISHDWGESVQTTDGRLGSSFYLGQNGWCEFSGGLNSAFNKSLLEDTGERNPGSFWFFHHDLRRAHNDVTVQLPCRVYRKRDETSGSM